MREEGRDIQRNILRDLAALASDCAAMEAQIEKRHGEAVAAAAKEAERARWAAEERARTAEEAAQQEFRNRTEQIEARHQADVRALTDALKTARHRAQIDSKSSERDIKKEYDQAVWLAESVLDGTQARAREEHKKAIEQLEKRLAEVNQQEARTLALMATFGHRPPPAVEPAAAPPEGGFEELVKLVEQRLAELSSLQLPRLFVGATPLFVGLTIFVVVIGATQFLVSTQHPAWGAMGIAFGVTAVLMTAIGIFLRISANKQVRLAYAPLRHAIDAARARAQKDFDDGKAARDQQLAAAKSQSDAERQAAKDKFAPLLVMAANRRDAILLSAQTEYTQKLQALNDQRQKLLDEAEQTRQRMLEEARRRREQELESARQRDEQRQAENQQNYERERAELESRLREGLVAVQKPMSDASGASCAQDWDDPAWKQWTPPRHFPAMVRFGQMQVDLRQIAREAAQDGRLATRLPESFTVPAGLWFPRQCSLLIQAGREGRDAGIRMLRMIMTRLLTCLPPGRVRFTIIDPVGLGQNFAGFMHLADHDEALVGTRIWTESEHIEQRLADLTEHMETVIQKYLRNEFETIDQYNEQAGELAEPYRFLVIADFPIGFEGEAFRRLGSIASTGSRCGVYTLVLRDLRQPLPGGAHIDELEGHSVNLVWEDGRFVWKDEVFKRFPLTIDPPPSEEFLTGMMDRVGKAAKDAKRVEVPFEAIAPAEDQIWSASAADELRVPIGRLGATRLQTLRLGRGVAQHALVAGKTGSGKSTLLHVLVTNLALWYPPDEVEFYLVDFKKGVEFKTYATHVLPHARAIAVESDREFGLSVLHRIDAELTRRGALFRQIGVQDLPSYRAATGQKMPRTLLIIDEFQEFFSEDDKLAQDAALLLDRLVRQGRAFGIHILLGSQTIGGTSGLARSTLGQMAVRVALQCSEADSQLILGDNNSAARLLSRPGEAIYNDAGGLVEHNSPFQISWLEDEQREKLLRKMVERARENKVTSPEPAVFEGNSPADLSKNKALIKLLAMKDWPAGENAAQAWLGEAVAIKDPTAVTFRRQSGANVLMIGQQEEPAMALMCSSILSISAQSPPAAAQFWILDGSPADSALAQVFGRMQAAIPHTVRRVEYREVPDAIAELSAEMQRRNAEDGAWPSIYVIIYGLQRFRALRRQEESFSFSMEEGEKKPATDKQFAELLRDGPALGIHVIAWSDTAAAIDRTLDRNSLREFDNRVLFQMSATDSSNLIDSPLANKLGYHRALAYSEEQGTMEKFRPYAIPDEELLKRISASLKGRKVQPA